jgi:hypothetical protein
MIEPQPSIYIFGGIRVDEPMTTLTDLLVSAVCMIAFLRLSSTGTHGRAQFYFKWYFLLMAVATGLGGIIGHGFLYAFSFAWKLPGWIVSMFSVAFIERSSIENAKGLIKPWLGKFFLVLNVVELLTVMTVTIYTLNFRWVEFHSGYGLLGVMAPFHAYAYYRTRHKASLIMLAGVGIGCLAALTFMTRFSLHVWFNHLDLSHVLMAIGGWVFYLGARELKNGNGKVTQQGAVTSS